MKSQDTLSREGSEYGKGGNAFEKEIVEILNDQKNLKDYIKGSSKDLIFKKILDEISDKHHFDKSSIEEINASGDILRLKSGGPAKTDIMITISLNKEQIIETLSVKKSKKQVVSCHEYKYEDFSRVIDENDKKLKNYFKIFQENPTYSGFNDNLPSGCSEPEFSEILEKHDKKFSQWVLKGEHDHQNLIDKTKQISNFFLYKKIKNNTEDELKCVNLDNYIEELISNEKIKKKFSVPFTWTYPSKRRGKRIQLKVKLI